jgi:hypothetical protein
LSQLIDAMYISYNIQIENSCHRKCHVNSSSNLQTCKQFSGSRRYCRQQDNMQKTSVYCIYITCVIHNHHDRNHVLVYS